MTLMPSSFLPTAFTAAPFTERMSAYPFKLYAETPPVAPGHANQLRQKNEARHRRLEELRRTLDVQQQGADSSDTITSTSRSKIEKEYDGLLSLGDPYDPSLFTRSHMKFKTSHNEALASLVRNLCDEPKGGCPVFYLDGPDGGTTSHLLAAGFNSDQLYVANEWEKSVSVLRSNPYDLIAENCQLGRAQDALRVHWDDVEFVAYYLEGCGGQTDPIVQMVSSIFSRNGLATRFAIGFTLTQAEPSCRELIDRVQDVTRHITKNAKAKGYDMRHVGDDPERYGVSPDLNRKHDGVCTSWVICSKVDSK